MGPKERVALDQQLAERAMRGDAEAFGSLVRRYGGAVYNHCARYVGPDSAEDCSQETFIRAFVHRQRFDARRPVLPWLLTIARHVCIDSLRSKRRPAAKLDDRIQGTDAGIEEQINAREEVAMAAAAYRDLPEGPQNAVALFHFEGLSYREVAEALEVPLGTVMTWLHRGRDRIKQAVLRGRRDGPAPLKEEGRRS